MAQDSFEQASSPRGGARVVVAGVVGACALGVGLGLWARPSDHEQGLVKAAEQVAPAPDAEPKRTLQIVVDDSPAPIGRPLEVLPSDPHHAAPAVAAPPPAAAEPVPVVPVVPRGPPGGLMKVAAPAEPELEILPPEPRPEPRAEAARPKPAPAAPKVEKAVAKVAAVEKAPKPRAAKAEPKPAAKPDRTAAVKVAKADKPRPATKAREAETKAQLAALMRVVQAEVRRAEARERAQTLAAAKSQKAKLERARLESAKADKARVQAARIEKAKLERAKLEKARLEKAKAVREKPVRPAVVKASAPRPKAAPPARPAPRGAGPLRMAKNTCASIDPGEAIVCASPRLSVRERQLQRAYRDAEAAGVPASELRRQQQRWEAQRAAAAREAPWAVEEVYEARIAELNDQSRADHN